MKRCFKFMPKHQTYSYLKNRYENKKRIAVSRYGDGEYFIIEGKKDSIAKQILTEELNSLLNVSVRTTGQLICLPAKIKVNLENINEIEDIKFSDFISRYIIKITDHSLYGQGQWRMIDLIRNKSEFITNFFLDRTLIITGHKNEADYAFKKMKKVHVYETPTINACSEYKIINKEIINLSKKYKNIIFACGPLSKILIADLIRECNSNLIDLGSVLGIIINPYSGEFPVVNKWSGFGKKGDKKVVERCSIDFFDTLRKKYNSNIKKLGWRDIIYAGKSSRKI